jgi:hypothetical protein
MSTGSHNLTFHAVSGSGDFAPRAIIVAFSWSADGLVSLSRPTSSPLPSWHRPEATPTEDSSSPFLDGLFVVGLIISGIVAMLLVVGCLLVCAGSSQVENGFPGASWSGSGSSGASGPPAAGGHAIGVAVVVVASVSVSAD